MDGFQDGGIRIIILRRWFFHWIGPVRREFAEKAPFPIILPGGISSPAPLCGIQGRSSIDRQQPAEPDDPDSPALKPNLHKKMGEARKIGD